MQVHHNTIVYLPDYLFAKYCEDEYGLNRGVYNTIDKWIYERNETMNVEERRKRIIDFIEFYQTHNENNREFKVGRGNLSKAFHAYWYEISVQT